MSKSTEFVDSLVQAIEDTDRLDRDYKGVERILAEGGTVYFFGNVLRFGFKPEVIRSAEAVSSDVGSHGANFIATRSFAYLLLFKEVCTDL